MDTGLAYVQEPRLCSLPSEPVHNFPTSWMLKLKFHNNNYTTYTKVEPYHRTPVWKIMGLDWTLTRRQLFLLLCYLTTLQDAHTANSIRAFKFISPGTPFYSFPPSMHIYSRFFLSLMRVSHLSKPIFFCSDCSHYLECFPGSLKNSSQVMSPILCRNLLLELPIQAKSTTW